MSGLTLKDLEDLQSQHPDYQMELAGGEIIMSPSGLESDEVSAAIVTQLCNRVRPHSLGRVPASSADFILSNADQDVGALDVGFVQAERLKKTTENYADII